MDYHERPPPAGLEDRVAARWTLRCDGDPAETLRHIAAPDGCLELIFRRRGRSHWRSAQPVLFVAGMITAPAELEISGDAHFEAVRIWPWAWNALGGLAAPLLIDGWQPLDEAVAGIRSVDEALERIAGAALDQRASAIGRAAVVAASVQALSHDAGLAHRSLQRWFLREIGVAPRHYLRLVRFNQAFAAVQSDADSLAQVAAERGYADQAHMARDFRDLAGTPARTARAKARGPFL